MKVVETVCRACIMGFMGIKRIAKEGITHPFGDHRSVKQAFPSGISAKEADPFLMCDFLNIKGGDMEFNVMGKNKDNKDDNFAVDWHPHRGFDIASYLKSGTGRHGDSLGNRVTYSTPGMQWMSTGSGVEHAEGGDQSVAAGESITGFQIWINVPADRKMDDPRYGTVPTEDLPQQEVSPGVMVRVLAGNAFGVTGAFETIQPVQMIDFELEPNTKANLDVGIGLDNTILYVYEGELSGLNDKNDMIVAGSVVLLDASSDDNRGVEMRSTANATGAKVMLFAGKKLNEPIAWHGPIVMNTQDQIRQTFQELRSGNFPPVRVDWDYKRISTKPK